MRKGFLLGALIALLSTIKPGLPDNWVTSLVSRPVMAEDLYSGIGDKGFGASSYRPAKPEARTAPTYQLRKGQYLGKFRVTFYWLVEEEAYSGKKTVPLYTTDGQRIGMFTPQFVKDFRIESCALLADGRIISYMKRANRCAVVDAPIGINGFTLSDLRSVAVDPNVIRVGSTVYIPDADDVAIGSNFYHDGVFRAHDIGGAIKGDRIDVYLGLKSNMDYFRSTTLCRSGYVDVYLLQ